MALWSAPHDVSNPACDLAVAWPLDAGELLFAAAELDVREEGNGGSDSDLPLYVVRLTIHCEEGRASCG